MNEITIRDDVTVSLMQHTGDDRMIVAAARVSTKGELSQVEFTTKNEETESYKGLINFLMKNRHGTPFEHGAMTFYIQAPIFVFREFHRHRVGWSYNEESGRYKQLDPVFYIPNPERPIKQEGKPGHYVYVAGTPHQVGAVRKLHMRSFELAYAQYETLLKGNIAREVARACLPVGIYSSMYATCNPRSLMHFLGLRTKDEAAKFPSYPQYEIEMVAKKMEAIFAELFPVTYGTWHANGRVCP